MAQNQRPRPGFVEDWSVPENRPEPPRLLAESARCDRCGAAAWVRADLPDGGSIYFCGHDARLFEPGLAAIGAAIADDRAVLAARFGPVPWSPPEPEQPGTDVAVVDEQGPEAVS